MLRGEDANEPQQYDTLRGVRGGRGAKTPEQPSEGQYNTLSQVTDFSLIQNTTSCKRFRIMPAFCSPGGGFTKRLEYFL